MKNINTSNTILFGILFNKSKMELSFLIPKNSQSIMQSH